MRFFEKVKDGGPTSPVDGYVLIELKGLFSIMLLKFNKGVRHAYHTHAFNAWTWFLSGEMIEESLDGEQLKYTKALSPKTTLRNKNHRVRAIKDSWCFTIRGPWVSTWTEDLEGSTITLTHGRNIVK